jgi:plastocyanin
MKKFKNVGLAALFGSLVLAAWTNQEAVTAPVNSPTLILQDLKVQNEDENIIYITREGFDKPDHWVGKTIPVKWVNVDTEPHTVTDDEGYFNSGILQPGETFSFSFPKAGTWSYFDKFTGNRAMISAFGRDE